ncbi:ATP-binding protein [Salinimicrobium flavum]|uniref:histidine kinase n=1 Tax=Salinimicrobium flavum TaxID=1737065 RepID=A0ABW5IXG4_9FLAO
MEYNPIADQQLLILTDRETGKVKFINKIAENYCGFDSSSLKTTTRCFYKDFLHPDDQEGYFGHLQTLTGDFSKYPVRLKNKNGEWHQFLFKNRIYNGGKKSEIISLAHRLDAAVGKKGRSQEHYKPGYEVLENEYQQLLDSLDEGFSLAEVLFDEEGRAVDILFLKTNPAFVTQSKLRGIEGKTIREIFPTPKENWIETYGKVAVSGESIRFQDLSENLGNTWLDLFVFKVGKPDDRRVVTLFRNITDRKLSELQIQEQLDTHHKDLQESKQLLQTVFDVTNLATAVLRTVYNEDGTVKDFIFVRTNKVLKEMYLEQDVVGLTYLETSKHGVEMGIFDAFIKVMEGGTPLDKEFYYDREGYKNWFRVTARAQNDLLIVSIEDVTDRKIEAQELKDSIKFKEELVRTTPDVIMIINMDTYEVRYINKDIMPQAGITRKRVQGMTLPDLLPFVHPRDREEVMELHKKILKSAQNEIHEIEIRVKLKGVSWEYFNIRGKIFHRRDENWVEEYVLLVRNVSEQKSTQKALLKAETLSIQGEAARTFAHELRNPLASIGMVGEVLNKKLDEEQKKELSNYFEILKRSTSTLNNLVTNLLNASNYTPSVLEKEDLTEIMDRTIHKAADRVYLAGIKVIRNFKGSFLVYADKEKLEIALLNLIVNASEATIPGKGEIDIEILDDGTDVILAISDNGHGMEKDEIDRLFDAFYSKKETGMGIGLSSVKNILEEHDAQIKVSSIPNEGSTFRIYFPNAALI